jgi:hypothetical protein
MSLTNIWFWLIVGVVFLLLSYFILHLGEHQICVTFQRKVPLCHY